MAQYNGSIDLISGLRPKNNGNFPLVNAPDVQVDDDGTRLDEWIAARDRAYKPDEKTADMTQPVGVDENGKLWTTPGTGGSGDDPKPQTNKMVLGTGRLGEAVLGGESEPSGTSDYSELANKPSINGVKLVGNKTAEQLGLATPDQIPGKTSELENDSGFQDASQVNAAIAAAVAGIAGIRFEIVQTLPASGDSGTIYLITNGGSARNIYDEYIYCNGAWELLGTTEIDLTGYATERWVQQQAYLTQHQSLAAYRTSADQDTLDNGKLGTSGDGSNVTAAFTAAGERSNISTGEKLSALFGKIAKWFADLGTAAFRTATESIAQGSTDLVESGAVYAGLAEKYTKPENGIPASDLSTELQTAISGARRAISSITGTLTVAGWSNKSQSLSITGMTANSNFVASPSDAAGWAAAADAMLFPPTAAANALTFTCDTVPSADIPVTVYFWED